MKLSNFLYLLIFPLLMTPSLNASKDSDTQHNIQSVFVEQSLYPNNDRRCARNLRESEAANRYLEKEILVLDDELARANRRIKLMRQKIRDYEYKLDRYQKRSPRRPNAHGYELPSRKRPKKSKRY